MAAEPTISAGNVPQKRRRLLLVASAGGALALGFGVGTLWFARAPIAEGLIKSRCGQEDLDCQLKIERLDFRGVIFETLDVRAKDGSPILSGEQVALDLAWSSPWRARPAWIGGKSLNVTLDLTGKGPILGPLQAALDRQPKGETSDQPLPRLGFPAIGVRALTPAGPVDATGSVKLTDAETFEVAITAAPVSRMVDTTKIDLSAAHFVAKGDKGAMSGRLDLRIADLTGADVAMKDVDLKLDFAQGLEGALTARGAASLTRLAMAGVSLNAGQATANAVLAPIDLEDLDPDLLMRSVKSLNLAGKTGRGAYGDNGWAGGDLTTKITLDPEGGARGPVTVRATGVSSAMGEAKTLDLTGDVVLAPGKDGALAQSVTARGQAVLEGASLSSTTSKTLTDALKQQIGSVAPSFGDAAASAARLAGDGFRLVLPWSLNIAGGAVEASALDGAELRSDSGFFATVKAGDAPSVFTWKQGASESGNAVAASWTAGGHLDVGGGGGPPLSVELADLRGDEKSFAGRFDAVMSPWKVGKERLEAEAKGVDVGFAENSGRMSGAVRMALTGGFAGGVWTGAEADGQLQMAWSPEGVAAQAPDGFSLAWKEARYGSTAIGAGKVVYTPTGSFARRIEGGAVAGSGAISALKAPVAGDGFKGDLSVTPVRIDWTYDDRLKANFRTAHAGIVLDQDAALVPISLGQVSGSLVVDKTWRASGSFAKGDFRTPQANGEDLNGKFDLSGRGGDVFGALDDVHMQLVDPNTGEAQVFEPLAFNGKAKLDRNNATFAGDFTLVKSGVSMGAVSGKHDLDTGAGEMTFAPTVLVFRERVFEPSEISPRLRGPANVTGQIAISGVAAWTKDSLTSRASVDVRKLGFALASAGVFEGVSGRVEISDVLAMKSAPGQQLTLDRVTLGMPIETGTITFQLIGFDGVRLESAYWPFVGGFIRVLPTDFMFSAAQNRIVAVADRWDLHALIDQFKVPDLKMEGYLSGEFPVVFTTGSARIDHAVLKASEEGGVIQYTGAVGSAAGNTDPNAALLFDALKDFKFRVLSVELDGELTGRITMKSNIQGSNSDAIRAGAKASLLAGTPFDLNIGIDSSPLELFGNLNRANSEIQDIVGKVTGIPR